MAERESAINMFHIIPICSISRNNALFYSFFLVIMLLYGSSCFINFVPYFVLYALKKEIR
jgi:hypothetical protein